LTASFNKPGSAKHGASERLFKAAGERNARRERGVKDKQERDAAAAAALAGAGHPGAK